MVYKSYPARFYDGESVNPYIVQVSLRPEGIEIIYRDTQDRHIRHLWAASEVIEVQRSSAILMLRKGEGSSYMQVEITDREFIESYLQRFHAKSQNGILNSMRKHGWAWVILAIVLFLLAGYLWLLPWLADSAVKYVPVDYEISLGNQIRDEILKTEKVDRRRTVVMNNFFDQMEHNSPYPVSITVVKKDIANAYALPGGSIIVYSSMLDSMKSFEELAALLSHEFGHVHMRHTTRGIFRSLAGALFVSMLFGDMNGVAQMVIRQAHDLRNLSYSRRMEQEADDFGLTLLEQNLIDVKGMKLLFQILKRQQQMEINEMLSTHPDLDNRISNVETYMENHAQNIQINDSMDFYFKQLKNLK